MDSTSQLQVVPCHIEEPAQQLCTDALKRYLIERGYARATEGAYLGYAVHFFRWARQSGLDVHRVDETLVAQFLDDHLPHCTCGWPTRGDQREAHAALGHLLVVLRTLGVVAPRPVSATPVDEELRRFDEYMERVRGLAPRTRSAALRIVRELLWQRFHDRPVVFSALKPEQVRCCFARMTETMSCAGQRGRYSLGAKRLLPLPRGMRRRGARIDRCPVLSGELATSFVAKDAYG